MIGGLLPASDCATWLRMRANRKTEAVEPRMEPARGYPELTRRAVALVKEVFPEEELKIDVRIGRDEYILLVYFLGRGEDEPLTVTYHRHPEGKPDDYRGELDLGPFNLIDHKAEFLRLFAGFHDIVFGEGGDTPSSQPADTSRAGMGEDNLKQALKKARADLAVARLTAAYEVLVRHVDLSNSQLAEDERLRRAERLVKTYKRLRRLKPDFHDTSAQLILARSITNKRQYRRQQEKKAPPLTMAAKA